MKDSIDLGTMNIPRLFRKLLIPTVLGMVFSAIFIITDGIFVGKGIGSDALTAVNITAPLFLLNTGVALMFGIGASVVASIHLSHRKIKVAQINITQAVIVSSLLLTAYANVRHRCISSCFNPPFTQENQSSPNQYHPSRYRFLSALDSICSFLLCNTEKVALCLGNSERLLPLAVEYILVYAFSALQRPAQFRHVFCPS